MNANTTPNLDAALEDIAAMYSGPSVYSALADGFTGTDTELTAHIGAGHIKSGVRTVLNALKAHGVVTATKTDPNNHFSPTVWSLVHIPADDNTVDADDTADDTDRDAAFAAALADVMGDTDGDAGPALLNELMDLGPVTPAKPRKPRTNSKGQVRLLAVYPNDPEPSDGTRGPGKAMERVTAWFEANPGTHRIADIAKGLDTKWTADVLKTVRRVMAADPRVTQVDGARFATFTFTPADAE